MSLRARNPASRSPLVGDKDYDNGPSAKTADKQVVQLGLSSALAAAVSVALAMCVLAGLVSLVIIWLVPPPGTRDLPTEMPWVRFNAFDPSHDYVNGIYRTGFTVLPNGVAYQDVEQGTGHTVEKGDFMVIHYKMYLAAPVSGKADRFPFVFSRADTHHTLYAMYGEHGEELLEGVEDGMVGMKAHGKRKIVIPPAHGYGAAGFTHTTGMTKVVVPPNSTLLFFVELLQAGKYASQRHPEVNHEEL